MTRKGTAAFRCAVCGQYHDNLPHVGHDRPVQYWDIPEEERDRRIKLTADHCIIDDKYFFIRGVIEIPVFDYPDSFGFGVWVSQKEENFRTYLDHADEITIGPFFGWLCTQITYYPESTLYLKTRAHFRGGNLRPSIEVEPSDHPLAVDQKDGISLEKAWDIVHFYEKG